AGSSCSSTGPGPISPTRAERASFSARKTRTGSMAAKKKAPPKAKGKSKRGVKLAPNAVKRGLSATEVALPLDHPELADVVALVTKAGGAPLGAYREPLGGRPLLLASLPFSAVQPTPFQR